MAVTERVIAKSGPRAATPVLSAPFAFGTDGTDMLRVRLWCYAPRSWPANGRQFRLMVRSVETDGTLQVSQLDLTATADVVVSSALMTLSAGALQTIGLSWAGTALTTMPGITYGIVDLVRGTQTGAQLVVGTLVAGYVGPGLTLTWPGSVIKGPFDGPGYQATIAFLPGVGAEVNIPAFQNVIWKLKALEVQFTASAAAGNRWPSVYFLLPLATMPICPFPAAVAPTVQFNVAYMPGAAAALGSPGFSGVASLPPDLVFRFGDSIRTLTLGLAAGDQYTVFNVHVEQWIEPLP